MSVRSIHFQQAGLPGMRRQHRPAITVTCVPHSEWQYAGGGYIMLRKLLSDVTGLPFAQLMHDAVLLPRV